MHLSIKKLSFFIAIIWSQSVFAGGSTTPGTLSNFYFMGNGSVLFTTSGTDTHASTDQTCVTLQPSQFALDATTNQGKAQLSGLLMAYSTGKQVVIYGTGTCTVHPQRETVDYFYTVS